MLLCDSGGQYLDGTTDITRTVSFTDPTDQQKLHYTLVLKGMIGLSMAKFPVGTQGNQLDTLARMHLWQHGLNYGHGTGHGVGFFMNVHEPPQGFAPGNSMRSNTKHDKGMLSSNEPGYYLEGEYGIRIENLMVVVKDKEGWLKFDTITLFPIATNLIDMDFMTTTETQWLNDYHQETYDKVSPQMDEEHRLWLKEKCRAV
jgi:Xaa-Pro aminopeptidase